MNLPPHLTCVYTLRVCNTPFDPTNLRFSATRPHSMLALEQTKATKALSALNMGGNPRQLATLPFQWWAISVWDRGKRPSSCPRPQGLWSPAVGLSMHCPHNLTLCYLPSTTSSAWSPSCACVCHHIQKGFRTCRISEAQQCPPRIGEGP